MRGSLQLWYVRGHAELLPAVLPCEPGGARALCMGLLCCTPVSPCCVLPGVGGWGTAPSRVWGWGGGQPVAALAEALGNGDLSVGDWLQM